MAILSCFNYNLRNFVSHGMIYVMVILNSCMLSNWILIADDDLEDQEMIIEVIEQLDKSLTIETASDGQEALNRLTRQSTEQAPCLLILDFKMPYLNAAELLETLAKNDKYAHIPKVVWSTSNRQEDVKRCLKAGASHYFVKPSRASELRTIVGQMLEYCKMKN
jgi:CheY-like chemotaxis protein